MSHFLSIIINRVNLQADLLTASCFISGLILITSDTLITLTSILLLLTLLSSFLG